MKRSSKLMFAGCGRSLRRELHELDRHPAPRFRMDHIVPKPRFVRLADGRTVEYAGP